MRVNIFILLLFSTMSFSRLELVVAVDFDGCLADFRSGKFGQNGGTDNRGHTVSNITAATGLTYSMCLTACGSDQVPFNWTTFFQRFSTWLLPWLALMSQLPFGAEDKLDNVESVLLTVGSPTLAAYSLALTVLNGRWVARRFSNYHWPNTRNAVRVLCSLQQSPLRVNTNDALLASLVVLPQNDEWWKELVMWLNYTHSWSISAITSITWVIIAYLFTVVDSFTGNIMVSIPSNGQGVGSIWIWLLPVVIGWLQISPKCDRSRLREALNRVNNIAWVASPRGDPILADKKAISLHWNSDEDADVHADEQCTAPLYNYARFFTWTEAVEEIAEVFRAVSKHSHLHESVDPNVDWVPLNGPHPHNRIGDVSQIQRYCDVPDGRVPIRSRHGYDVVSRMIVASIFALLLSWGTTGAALVVGWFTYTYGLGCRAGSYVIYGILSTISWILLVISSILVHRSRMSAFNSEKATPGTRGRYCNGSLAITTRRIGKAIAAFNAVWVVAACLFQFSNFYNRCFCNSSIFSLWNHAYVVIEFGPADVIGYRKAWIGGVGLAAGTAFIFTGFVSLFVNPTLPDLCMYAVMQRSLAMELFPMQVLILIYANIWEPEWPRSGMAFNGRCTEFDRIDE